MKNLVWKLGAAAPKSGMNIVNKAGFTLAEMMVVMLILSIVLAAMAPVMTTRNKTDYSSPWRYASNGSDAYFAGNSNSNQVAMIGQHEVGTGEDNARLILRTSSGSGWSHLMFKTGDTIVGRLYLDESNLYLSNVTNPSGSESTSVGVGALSNNTGENNTAIGNNALHSNTSGSGNVAMGTYALQHNTTGNDNIAIGTNSNYGNFTSPAAKTIAIGNQTSAYGNGSISIGSSLTSGEGGGTSYTGAYSSGVRSIALGNGASSTESDSIAIGTGAESGGVLLGVDTGISSIAIGNETSALGNNSVSIGSSSSGVGWNSVAIGNGTVSGTGSVGDTVAIGFEAISEEEDGIAIGNNAVVGGNYGTSGIAIGTSASVLGSHGIAIGDGAKSVSSQYGGGYNIAIGSGAMGNATRGEYSIAIGAEALNKMNGTAGADPNIGIGYKALMNLVSGSGNVAIGPRACQYVTGSNKTCIGTNSGPVSGSDWASSSDSTERIFIGSTSKFDGGTAVLEVHNDSTKASLPNAYGNISNTAVVIHGALVVTGPIYNRYKAIGSSSSKFWGFLEAGEHEHVVIGSHSGQSGKYYYNDYRNSDRRLKYVGRENTSGLDKIRQLKVFNYTFKKDEKKTPHVGVIAQDLQKVFPDAVKKGVDGFLTIRMEDMFYAVINAIKELDSRVTALEKENQELKARIERLEAKIK